MLRPARQKKRTHGAPEARRHYPIAKAGLPKPRRPFTPPPLRLHGGMAEHPAAKGTEGKKRGCGGNFRSAAARYLSGSRSRRIICVALPLLNQ